jgi:hypothetical protein
MQPKLRDKNGDVHKKCGCHNGLELIGGVSLRGTSRTQSDRVGSSETLWSPRPEVRCSSENATTTWLGSLCSIYSTFVYKSGLSYVRCLSEH